MSLSVLETEKLLMIFGFASMFSEYIRNAPMHPRCWDAVADQFLGESVGFPTSLTPRKID